MQVRGPFPNFFLFFHGNIFFNVQIRVCMTLLCCFFSLLPPLFFLCFRFKRNELLRELVTHVSQRDFREIPNSYSVIMSHQKNFLHRKVVLFSGYFCVLFSKLMQTLFWVFNKIVMRYYSSKAMNSAFSTNFSYETHQTKAKTEAETDFSESFEEYTELKSENFESVSESNQIDSEEEAGFMEECSTTAVDDSGNLGLEEEDEEEDEPSKLVFKFQYQSWNCNLTEEKSKESNGGRCEFVKRDTVSANTNKYQFFSGMSFSHFLDEPEASNFTVKELFIHSDDDFPLENQVTNDCEGGVNKEILDNSTEKVHKEELPQKLNCVPSMEQPLVHNLASEDDFICSSIDSDSIGSMGDGFLSDTDFGTTVNLDTLRNHDEENAGLTDEDLDFGDERDLENLEIGYEPDDFAEEDEDIMDDLRKLEDSLVKDSDMRGKKSSGTINSKSEESLKHKSDSLAAIDVEDSNRFDTLWEHQELIEQLKMELKKVKAIGLPTILEDSESPRIMEDLKPWNIDEKFQHGSTTNELPKFYRSYRERMRKFDILNYQKMYAIRCLQSKDTLQSFSCRKKSSPSIKSILPHGFRLSRRKNNEADPMSKFMRELYSDLEMVYVGQLCLSWEFLQWEYEKALELWESDQYGLRSFNEVAGEFQQFQVLLQRFIENEPFQGPRVENYTKNRCVMRNLLQVPVIRDDNSKDKKKFRQRGADEDAITSDMLVEILEESIRIIWRFIKGDKDASSLALKGARETTQVELQDPADSELLWEILRDLQKKEKRLRELLRSGNCILKKFKKHHEDGTDQVLCFFSQVDMKLVWRVLNMSRITTDQLAWCRSKLNKMSFVNRRIHVDPASFLLFPS